MRIIIGGVVKGSRRLPVKELTFRLQYGNIEKSGLKAPMIDKLDLMRIGLIDRGMVRRSLCQKDNGLSQTWYCDVQQKKELYSPSSGV